jgi:hypothetical protein
MSIGPSDLVAFRRSLLEALRDLAPTIPKSGFLDYCRLPQAKYWSHHVMRTSLHILQDERRVQLKPVGSACLVKLTAVGLKSLKVPEDQWQDRHHSAGPSSGAGNNGIAVSRREIGQALHAKEPIATLLTRDKLLQLVQIFEAIDTLIAKIVGTNSFDDLTRADSELEARQLKDELRKSKPSPSRIQHALDWFQEIDKAGLVGFQLTVLANKLKPLMSSQRR